MPPLPLTLFASAFGDSLAADTEFIRHTTDTTNILPSNPTLNYSTLVGIKNKHQSRSMILSFLCFLPAIAFVPMVYFIHNSEPLFLPSLLAGMGLGGAGLWLACNAQRKIVQSKGQLRGKGLTIIAILGNFAAAATILSIALGKGLSIIPG